eukprot:404841-Alexandrium_andersonii.AAC.1
MWLCRAWLAPSQAPQRARAPCPSRRFRGACVGHMGEASASESAKAADRSTSGCVLLWLHGVWREFNTSSPGEPQPA